MRSGGAEMVSADSANEISRQLFLCALRHFNLRGADVLDFDRCGAVNVAVVAIEADFACYFEFVFRQFTVLKPELHGTFGVADRRAVTASRSWSEGEECLRPVFRQVPGIRVAISLKIFRCGCEIGGLHGRRLEVSRHQRAEPPEA